MEQAWMPAPVCLPVFSCLPCLPLSLSVCLPFSSACRLPACRLPAADAHFPSFLFQILPLPPTCLPHACPCRCRCLPLFFQQCLAHSLPVCCQILVGRQLMEPPWRGVGIVSPSPPPPPSTRPVHRPSVLSVVTITVSIPSRLHPVPHPAPPTPQAAERRKRVMRER